MKKLLKTSRVMYLLMTAILFSTITQSCQKDENQVEYKVTIISNGGTNIAPIYVKSGEKLPESKLYPNPIISDGGKFLAWYTDPNLRIPFDFNMPITQNMTLYAKWLYNTFTISFKMNGAEARTDTQAIEGRVFVPVEPVLANYKFVNWYEDSIFSMPYNPTLPVLAPKTLFARWVKESPSAWFAINESGLLTSCTPPDGTTVVVIPEGVKEIPAWFVISNGLNEAGKPGLPNGKGIKEFILPKSLTTIGEGAFKFSAITSMIIPPNITTLESLTFEGCSNLTSLTFATNSKLERLKSNSNNDPVIGASVLKSISFPPSLTYVGKYTMKGCTSLQVLTFERTLTPVIFDPFLTNGGVWLFNGYFPAKIRVPSSIKSTFLTEMRKVMQDYEYGKMSAITEGY